MKKINLNANEKEILYEMARVDGMDLEDEDCGHGDADDMGAYNFAYFVNERMDRKAVRRACRSLARKGFAKCHHGLWNEEGEPMGSGYAVTQDGIGFAYELAKAEFIKEKQPTLV